MSDHKQVKDRHLPAFLLDNPLRRLFGNSKTFNHEVSPDQVVADLGCGPGFYTMALADAVGPKGRVYAVDSDEKVVSKVKRKAEKKSCANIETHTSSAARLDFIESDSVDYVLANGLLC
jgi:ubiquinone/menaquinone biosynthesis C-methylase UbiE